MSLENDTAILELIDDIVAKNTFSLEALDSIKALKDKVQEQEKSITKLEEQKKQSSDLYNSTYADTIELRKTINELREENRKLIEQEEKAKASIYEAEKQAAVAAAYKDAMQIVFKPHTVRESVVGSKQLMTPSGYPSSYPESQTIDRTFE